MSPTDVGTAWLDNLPPFVSADTIARLFDIPRARAVRWMSTGELPRAKRPDNQYVTAREHVVTLAVKLYGDMGYEVDSHREFRDDTEVHGAAESTSPGGDGLD